MKFRRKAGLTGPHPLGFAGIGIHALDSDRWMTLEEIMFEHESYYRQYPESGLPPSYGELIRDIGLFICMHAIDIQPEE